MIKIFYKAFVPVLIAFCLPSSLYAMNPVDSIGTKKVKGEKFIVYKVEKKQTWFSIAKKYGLTAKQLQSANEDLKAKPLGIGASILIPLKKQAASKAKTSDDNDAKPIYHTVKKGETLYSIAIKSNQTTKDIKKWNDLKSNNLKLGQEVIIGYEKKKKEVGKPVVKEHKAKKDSVEKAPIKKNEATDKAPEPKKEIEVKKPQPDSSKKVDTSNSENREAWKNPTVKGRELEEHGMATFIEDEDINPNKYYALHRSAPKGTIIKVTNIMNKKQIYVKVIGKLPDTGDNNDLLIKMSKAGAMKLGVLDTRFQVVLNYFGE